MPNIREYIDELQKIVREHGSDDLEMVDEEGEPLAFPEFNDDDGPCVVACAKR